MTKNRRRFSADYKIWVALEAAKGQEILSELASKYGLHPNQISQWKRQVMESGADVYNPTVTKKPRQRMQNNPNYTSRLAASRWN